MNNVWNSQGANISDVVKHKLRVTSYELEALKHDLKFKSTSWNSNPRVARSNPQVTSSNPQVTNSNPRVQES